MRPNNLKYLFTAFIVAVFIASCKKPEVIDPTTNIPSNNTNTATNPNKDVNTWIYEQMKTYYYWTDKIPDISKTDLTLQPGVKAGDAAGLKYYFNSLLYDEGKTDRFSWIDESADDLTSSLGGVSTTKVMGISQQPVYLDAAKVNVGLFISYVIKNSPAEKAGLKRGDVIMTVNGVQITGTNYTTILQPEVLTLGLGELKNDVYVLNGKTANLTKVDKLADNPVHFSKIIEKNGKKIGYFVYRQFIPGLVTDTDPSNDKVYDNEIRQIFADFKAQGVSDIILDLRINGGGYISSAVVISSLIGKNVNSSKLMYYDEYNALLNQEYQKQYGANALNNYFLTETNNIGNQISKLYVLTSPGTASASELVINSLRPYMPVVLVGDHTYGKNVGSFTIKDKSGRFKWGLQPITLKTFNSNKESNYGTERGFEADYYVKETLPYKNWGDETDPLLAKALSVITGNVLATTKTNANARLSTAGLRNDFGENTFYQNYEMVKEMPKK